MIAVEAQGARIPAIGLGTMTLREKTNPPYDLYVRITP
jgi:hypothetical protein